MLDDQGNEWPWAAGMGAAEPMNTKAFMQRFAVGEQQPRVMTARELYKLKQRDFGNGAIIDEIAKRLEKLERMEAEAASRNEQYANLLKAGEKMREGFGRHLGHPRDAEAAGEYFPNTCSLCGWDAALAALAKPGTRSAD